MRRCLLLVCLPALACGPEREAPKAAGEAHAFDAGAAGVTRVDSAAGRHARIIPLGPMSDVQVLFGDPEKAGEPFVIRIRELPGTLIPPHSHPVDEHITVVQGSFLFGMGEKWDLVGVQVLQPGAYAFAPAGSTMYGGSPEGAIVQVHGIGPFHIRWRNGLHTLDDADAAAHFRYRRGDRVRARLADPFARRGSTPTIIPGVIQHGYGSGDIIQYEVRPDTGGAFMASERDIQRP